MRPLRVGILVNMFPQLSETFIVTKVVKLLDAGIDVQIFATHESPHWDRFGVLAGRDDIRRRVHAIPQLDRQLAAATRGVIAFAAAAWAHPISVVRLAAYQWRRRPTLYSALKALYLQSAFTGSDLDVLHIEFDSQGIWLADVKGFLGCRLLCSARGTFQETSVLDTTPDAPKQLFEHVDGYHFISRFLERNTHALGLPRDTPTWLVEPAIDLRLFSPPARVPRDPVAPLRVISVGRLAWAKGYEFALEAIANARAAGIAVEYTIHGAGPYEEAIRFAIQQLELGDCVRLPGAAKREDMPAAYADADIMLHAALDEGFCNAVIEAQAMMLPVVTSDAGGLPENVEHGVTGFVVPRRDSAALAERLIELARDPALRARMGAAGRKRALARFDLDRQTEAFVKLYRDLAALPARRADIVTRR